jgi:hypothetical protein
MSMSDELTAPAPKKRGRKPGPQGPRKKRVDPASAPVDGFYAPLDVVGKKPGFQYVALSPWDRRRRGHQFEAVRWSETSEHPPYEVFTDEMRGKEVMLNGQLFLMRVPLERDRARKESERRQHRAAMNGIAQGDADKGLTPTAKTMVTHNIPVHHVY